MLNHQKDNQDFRIKALFYTIGGWIYFIISLITLLISFIFITYFIQDLLWIIIIFLFIILVVIFVATILAKSYCSHCDKNVYPIFNDHYCLSMFKDMKRKIRNYFLWQLYGVIEEIEDYVNELIKLNLITDDEKEVLRSNLTSLRIFENLPDYKYTMITMGSLLEFLLIRYCKNNKIEPEPYDDPFGNNVPANKKIFINYIQSAIKINLFKRKNSWHIIQHNLRNFRNYVHINKELKDEKIDKEWYKTIKPHFERILNDFKSQN